MNHATIPIIDHETCEDNYRNETGHSNDTSWSLHESFVCAGNGKDRNFCDGQLGSPLVCRDMDDPKRYDIFLADSGLYHKVQLKRGIGTKIAHCKRKSFIHIQLANRSLNT